jgi:hypothetical protein
MKFVGGGMAAARADKLDAFAVSNGLGDVAGDVTAGHFAVIPGRWTRDLPPSFTKCKVFICNVIEE